MGHGPAGITLRFRRGSHFIRVRAVGANVLLHIVFSREGLVTDRAVDALFAGVLLAMASGVAGRRECRCAAVAGCVGAGILVLSACGATRSGLGRGRL